MRTFTGALLIVFLAGCTTMATPSSNLINERPVVILGSSEPQDKDYILHVPAGQEFPVQLTVDGSMLKKSGEAKTQVSFKRDVYLYKHWASYNGREWKKLDKLLGLTISAGMKSDGGLLRIDLEERP